MALEQIVSVNISRSTAAVAAADMGIVNILSSDCNFTDAIRTYTDLASVATDMVGGSASLTYRKVAKMLSQAPRVTTFKITNYGGYRTVYFDSGTFTSGSVTITVNGTPYTTAWGTSKAATLTAVQNAIDAISGVGVTAVNVGASGVAMIFNSSNAGPFCLAVSVTKGGSDTITAGIAQTGFYIDNAGTWTAGPLTYVINGTSYTQAWGTSKSASVTALNSALVSNSNSRILAAGNLSGNIYYWICDPQYAGTTVIFNHSAITGTMILGEATPSPAVSTDTLDAACLVDNNWYYLLSNIGYNNESATVTAIQALAAWAESKVKFFITQSNDVTNINSAVETTSLPALIKASGYTRSVCVYTATPQASLIDAAVAGKIAPLKPGSYTVKFKALVGVTPDSLTSTQETNAKAKNTLVYLTIGSNNMLSEGKVASGEWIDTIIGIDWQTSLIKTNVFSLFTNTLKVPYDDKGIAAVGQAVSQSLDQGIFSGLYTPITRDKDGNITGGYVITLPKAASVSAADKNNRVLNNVNFTAYLAGAIHSTVINGTVTV